MALDWQGALPTALIVAPLLCVALFAVIVEIVQQQLHSGDRVDCPGGNTFRHRRHVLLDRLSHWLIVASLVSTVVLLSIQNKLLAGRIGLDRTTMALIGFAVLALSVFALGNWVIRNQEAILTWSDLALGEDFAPIRLAFVVIIGFAVGATLQGPPAAIPMIIGLVLLGILEKPETRSRDEDEAPAGAEEEETS